MATQPIQPARAVQTTANGLPSLPDLSVLEVPDGHVLLLKARGKGVQIYPCDPKSHTFGAARPEAILLTDDGQIIHHFKGPTWRAADGSLVVGKVAKKVPAPTDNAIPWLLLTATHPEGSQTARFPTCLTFSGYTHNTGTLRLAAVMLTASPKHLYFMKPNTTFMYRKPLINATTK